MPTFDLYAQDPGDPLWQVPASGAARFSWEYDDGRDRLLALYQKGKDKQWDGQRRIDWDLEVDPYDPLGIPDESLTLYGTRHWAKMTERDKGELRKHYASWNFSQFLHGEQGAMVCAARIVESVPDLDAKFYSATQTMDEARHAEIYGRFLHEKIELVYPVNDNLRSLLGDTLRDARWDMPYLGMQVLIEGLALAAFGMIRDTTDKPLPRQILAYVMQDEARHVAFGRMALRDYYKQLSDMGFADEANEIRRAWKENGSGGGIAAVSDELSNALGFVGSVDECRDRLDEEAAAGINLHNVGVAGYDEVEEGRILEQLAK